MTLWHAFLLGILQGLTEFLPISSSGHLVIIPHLLDWQEPGLFLSAMLHTGTLIAIVIYFLDDISQLVKALYQAMRMRSMADPDARLALGLAVATLPAVVIGLLFEDWFSRLFGNPTAAASFLILTAFILILSEYLGGKARSLKSLSWFEALIIGFAQSLAIAPGLSRSATTIATGMFLGFRREDAARYSFLLAIPILCGVTVYNLVKLISGTAVYPSIGIVLVGTVTSAVAGYLAIAGLLALVRHGRLWPWPFAVYCAVLGSAVLFGLV